MQLLPCPAYSPGMSAIEHVCDFVGRHLTSDLCHAASKDEHLLRMGTMHVKYIESSNVLSVWWGSQLREGVSSGVILVI
ncbi:hypothetical protein TNCV_1542331 [Trichonephila clavipes]|nr:hypothetical protein TNCV_1542331 [Trichonephila clavipes]